MLRCDEVITTRCDEPGDAEYSLMTAHETHGFAAAKTQSWHEALPRMALAFQVLSNCYHI